MADPITALVDLVYEVRPDWDPGLVRLVLVSHQHQVHIGDLSIAALRAARNPDFHSPKTIGWRGPHWRDLATLPPDVRPTNVCNVCGKPEPRCYGERPGPDDHRFEPKAQAS